MIITVLSKTKQAHKSKMLQTFFLIKVTASIICFRKTNKLYTLFSLFIRVLLRSSLSLYVTVKHLLFASFSLFSVSSTRSTSVGRMLGVVGIHLVGAVICCRPVGWIVWIHDISTLIIARISTSRLLLVHSETFCRIWITDVDVSNLCPK